MIKANISCDSERFFAALRMTLIHNFSSNMQTLTQHLIHHLAEHPDQKDLVLIMHDLATIGKIISKETNRSGLSHTFGSSGQMNVQGEVVQKLDAYANNLCKDYLRATGHFAAMASEEEEQVCDMGGFGKGGKYVIAFDPVDGSSNIDVNVGIGTIFSVHKKLENIVNTDEAQFLQKGRDQVLAGYILYGASTVLVYTFGDGVHWFTLEPSIGEFLLSGEHVKIPAKYEIYSINEAYIHKISEKDRKFVEYLRDEKGAGSRYIGSLVADFHRNVLKGGVFMYPPIDKEGTGKYKPKLRLNYEAKPMAFLAEQAGGLACDGKQNILDIQPTSLHERVALIVGNSEPVEQYLKM